MRSSLLALSAAALVLGACATAQEHAASVRAGQDAGSRVTVGTVQREIRVGMTNAEVVQVLGSPNMVTTDENRRENWVYDKISTDTVYSRSSGGINALILGGGLIGDSAAAGGLGGAGYSSGAGARSTSQRTLTIIIKYDDNSRVRDFAYRSSSF
jgi:outer membrane protein assembly factor BamE (lipoprotein component of BamABCDE complex)